MGWGRLSGNTDTRRRVKTLVAGLALVVSALLILVAGCVDTGTTTSSASPTEPSSTTTTLTPGSSTTLATTLTTLPGDQEPAVVDGWKSAYRAHTQITAQMVGVDDGRAVWADQADSGTGEIHLFDVALDAERTLLTMEGLPGRPHISGDSVVFHLEAGDSSTINVHRLSTGETSRLSFDGWGSYPQASGNNLVWMQGTRTTPVIYKYVLCDLTSGISTVIAEVEQDQGGLGYATLVGDKWIVWLEWSRTRDAGYRSLSVETGEMQEVPVGQGDRPDALDGDTFYYVPGAGGDVVVTGRPQELRAYDLATGEDELIAKEEHGIQWTDAGGGRVAWASWDDEGRFIKIVDRTTGDITRLDIPGYQVGILQLKGDLLLWRAQRASPTATLGSGYVFAYDLETGVATRLSDTLTDAHRVSTDGTTVCFGQTRVRAGETAEEVVVFTRAEPGVPFPFSDVPGLHPYRTAVAGLVSAGVFPAASTGVPGGVGRLFSPEDGVTFADFAAMLVAALGLSPSDDPSAALAALGLPEPTGGAAATMTRKEVISLVVRVGVELRPGLITAYAGHPGTQEDFHKTGDPEVAEAEWSGLVDGVVGYFGGSWDPSLPASRGEVAQIIWNLAASGEDTP